MATISEHTYEITTKNIISEIKTLSNANEIFKKIESTFYAAATSSYSYHIEKLGKLIANIHDKDGTVVDDVMKIMCNSQYFNLKFGNELISIFMDIAEKQEKELQEKEKESQQKTNREFDLARLKGRNSAEQGLKFLFKKLLLTDEAAKATYIPILYPKFNRAITILVLDHIRIRFLGEALPSKETPANKMSNPQLYYITEEAFDTFLTYTQDYLQTTADHASPGFNKILPKGMKRPFTAFYESLEKLSPIENESSNNNNDIAKNKVITLANGTTKSIDAEKLGKVAVFASMIGMRSILEDWVQHLEKLIQTGQEELERFLYDDMAIQKTFKELLFDLNFYKAIALEIPTFLSKKISHNVNLSSKENLEFFENTFNQTFKDELLAQLTALNQNISDDEKVLIDTLQQALTTDTTDSQFSTIKFEKFFTSELTNFKEKRIALKIHKLLDDEHFNGLINSIATLQFSDAPEIRDQQINALLNAILNNKPEALNMLDDANFKNILQPFLMAWGKKLQLLLKDDFSSNAFKQIVKHGIFKHFIAEKVQSKFKLPISLDELPQMIAGLKILSPKNLVDFFNSIFNDPKNTEGLDLDKVRDIMQNPKSSVFNSLENFIPRFAHKNCPNIFSAFITQAYGLIPKGHDKFNKKWELFSGKLFTLSSCQDFKTAYKNFRKDKFFKQLFKIVFAEKSIYTQYNSFVSYYHFLAHYKKLNANDLAILVKAARSYNGHIHDTHTLVAAKAIKTGIIPEIPPASPEEGQLKRFDKAVQNLGLRGKVLDHENKQRDFIDMLAQVDSTLIDFDEKSPSKDEKSTVLLSKDEQRQYIHECETDIQTLLNDSQQLTDKAECINQLTCALFLAVDLNIRHNKYIKLILDKLKQPQALLTPINLETCLDFIVKNDKAESLHTILKYCSNPINMSSDHYQELKKLLSAKLESKYDNDRSKFNASTFAKLFQRNKLKQKNVSPNQSNKSDSSSKDDSSSLDISSENLFYYSSSKYRSNSTFDSKLSRDPSLEITTTIIPLPKVS